MHQLEPPPYRPPRCIGDEVKELLQLQSPLFLGSTDGAVAEAWLQSLQWCFGLCPHGSNLKE